MTYHDWWKYDEYTKVRRERRLRFLGITLWKRAYYRTIKGVYWSCANDLVMILGEMERLGILPAIDERSKVLEPGCNVGRNLFAIQRRYGCRVSGIDISRKAIEIAQNDIWRFMTRANFYVEDVLDTDFFDRIRENQFDLVFTRWHLVHLPRSTVKSQYIETLKRVGKIFIAFEPLKEGRQDTEFYSDGKYCLSWDDWVGEYGLEEYKSKNVCKLGNLTHVFYKA